MTEPEVLLTSSVPDHQIRPHLATEEEILSKARNRGLTDKESLQLIAAERDQMNDELEKENQPLKGDPYNWEALHTGNPDLPVFLAESIRDCMAFEAVGYPAAEYRRPWLQDLTEDLRVIPSVHPVVICLKDRKVSDELYRELCRLKIDCYSIKTTGSYSSAAEALEKDPEVFKRTLDEIARDPAKAEYKQQSAAGYIDTFLQEIKESLRYPPISTGFLSLDRSLGGGLRNGLIILMALSNVGKSALCLQIADQIAELSRKDVIYVTLEMTRSEHIARSISRLTLQEVQRSGYSVNFAKSFLDLTDARRYKSYRPEENRIITDAIERYKKYSTHIYFLDQARITVEDIRAAAIKHRDMTGEAPVIIIDYLQILSPLDDKAEVRLSVDRNIAILKALSKDLKTPIICISSINRSSYTGAITLSAGKESAGIEYAADQVLAFQFRDQSKTTDIDFEKKKQIREMEIHVLKSRNSEGSAKAYLNYQPKYNYFSEAY